MQINETADKIQDKFENFLNKYSEILSKPYFKCFKETLIGLLSASNPIVRQIVQYILGTACLKKKQERIGYHLDNAKLFEELNQAHFISETKKITEESLIIIDESNIVKPCAKKMEHLKKVRDGSTGEYQNGYYSFNATVVNTANAGSVSISPLYSYVYSNSIENETKNERLSIFLVESTIFSCNKGIYVFDRGYDDKKLMSQLVEQENGFVIRAVGNRDLIVDNEKRKFKDVVNEMELKHQHQCPYKKKTFNYGAKKVRINTDPHPTKNPNTIEVWLIKVRYDKKGGFFYFFASFKNNLFSEKQIGQKVLEIYSKRWKIEEQFRQIKQQLNLEKIQLLKYQRIQTLNLWMNILVNFIYSCKKFFIKADMPYSKYLMDHNKDYTMINGFAYYRITSLIQRIFLSIQRRKTKQYNTNEENVKIIGKLRWSHTVLNFSGYPNNK